MQNAYGERTYWQGVRLISDGTQHTHLFVWMYVYGWMNQTIGAMGVCRGRLEVMVLGISYLLGYILDIADKLSRILNVC